MIMRYKVGDEIMFLFYTVVFIGTICNKTYLLNGQITYHVNFGMNYYASITEKYIIRKINVDDGDDIIESIEDFY